MIGTYSIPAIKTRWVLKLQVCSCGSKLSRQLCNQKEAFKGREEVAELDLTFRFYALVPKLSGINTYMCWISKKAIFFIPAVNITLADSSMSSKWKLPGNVFTLMQCWKRFFFKKRSVCSIPNNIYCCHQLLKYIWINLFPQLLQSQIELILGFLWLLFSLNLSGPHQHYSLRFITIASGKVSWNMLHMSKQWVLCIKAF